MANDKLRARSLQVVELICAALPTAYETTERLRELVQSPDPHEATNERRAITSVAARLAACSQALLGILGEFDLDLADRDDLACGLADRGLLLPRRTRRFKKGRS